MEKVIDLTEKLLQKEEEHNLLDVSLQHMPSKEEIKEAHKKIFCSFCSQQIHGIWFKCVSEPCRELKVCNNCKTSKALAHTLVDSTKEIHLGFICDGCSVRKKKPNEDYEMPIIGIRYKCIHPECKKGNQDYCQECFDIKEHIKDHVLVEFQKEKDKKYQCNYGFAQDDEKKFKCAKDIPGKVFTCKHPECVAKDPKVFYCESCSKKNHTSDHNLKDVKSMEQCYCCEEEMKHKFICIQCDDYRFCDDCGTQYTCYENHQMLPLELYNEIMESDYAVMCLNDHNFCKNMYLDIVARDRLDKVQMIKDKKVSKPEEVGLSEGTFLEDPKKDGKSRKALFHKFGAKLVIRETMFVITKDYFNKIQEYLDPGSDTFKELFRLRLKCTLTKTLPDEDAKVKWTGWDFFQTSTLSKYEREYIDLDLSVGLHHNIDEKFSIKALAPTLLCDLNDKLGDFIHHLHGHIVIENNGKIQREAFHCHKEKCDSCGVDHFKIPLKVHPGECREEVEESEPSDGGAPAGDANSDTSDEDNKNADGVPEADVADGGDGGDAGDNGGEEEKGDQEGEGNDEGNEEGNEKEGDEEVEAPKDIVEFLLMDGKGLNITKDSYIKLEIKIGYHASQLKESNFEVSQPEVKEKVKISGLDYIAFLNVPKNLFLPTSLFLLRTLWIVVFSGMFTGFFEVPLDLFVLITYAGYPNAEAIVLKQKGSRNNSYLTKNLTVFLGLMVITAVFWVLTSSFTDAWGYLIVFSFVLELVILGIGSAVMNYRGIGVLQEVYKKTGVFYSKLDTASAVQASSECSKVKHERKDVIADLMMLELSSSAGILINTVVFGTAKFITIPGLQQFLAGDKNSALNSLFGGDDNGFTIVMIILLTEGLIFMGVKIGISYFITMQTDLLAKHVDHAYDILEYVEKLPEPIIHTTEFFHSEITNETMLNLKYVTFTCEKMGLKYSGENEEDTMVILTAIMDQIKSQHSHALFTFQELKKKIAETSHMSQIRIKIVKGELLDLIKEVEYKFLGKFKIDKEFIKKIYATVGAVAGTGAAAFLKSATGGNAESS